MMPSGIVINEISGAGAFQAPGSGRLFFFDAALRGPDLAQNLSLDAVKKYFGETGLSDRMIKLMKLYFEQRSARLNVGAGPVTIARVRSSTAVTAQVDLVDRLGSPTACLRFKAQGVGVSGNGAAGGLSVTISDSRATGQFDVAVKLNGVTVETYTGLTMDISASTYAVTKINQNSYYVVTTDLSPTVYGLASDNPANGTSNLAGGTDGAALVTADYTDALARLTAIDAGGFLYSPLQSAALGTAMLAAGGYKYAMLDCPAGQLYTANSTLRFTMNSSNGELCRGEAFTIWEPNVALPLTIAKIAKQMIFDAVGADISIQGIGAGPHNVASNCGIVGVTACSDAYL
jgi:hypothetical protein